MFAGKARVYPRETPERFSTLGLSHGWKGLQRANTLAYSQPKSKENGRG
jgi:hypothetical protein